MHKIERLCGRETAQEGTCWRYSVLAVMSLAWLAVFSKPGTRSHHAFTHFFVLIQNMISPRTNSLPYDTCAHNGFKRAVGSPCFLKHKNLNFPPGDWKVLILSAWKRACATGWWANKYIKRSNHWLSLLCDPDLIISLRFQSHISPYFYSPDSAC